MPWPALPALVLGLVLPLLVPATGRTASAQTPEQVRDSLVPPGMFVAAGAADPARIAAAIAAAREAGYEMVIVVNELELRPDPDAYALRVRQLGVGDPVLAFGPEGQFGVSSEAVDGTELLRAREAAEEATTPEAASEAFTDALLSEPEDTVPELVRDLVRAVLIALGVLVLSVLANEALRRNRRRRRARATPTSPPPG